MSMFDPFADLKKKKTNIFDFSTVSTQVPTQTPVNQYMTPIPKTAVEPAQAVKTPTDFGGFKTPDYGQGIFTPAQNNIFNSPSFQNELKTTPKGQNIIKQGLEMVEGDTYDAAFRDIYNGMTEQELLQYYPDIPKEKQTALLGLAADIQNGMPANQLKIYKDLPTSFLKKMFYNKDLASLWKDNLANKEDVFGYVKGNTKQDFIDNGLDQSLTVNFLGNQAKLGEGVRLVSNIPSGLLRLGAFFGNLATNPKKTVSDLVGGIGDILLNSAYKLDEEGISTVPGMIEDLADAVVTNPELVLGGEMTKFLKMGGSPIADVVKKGVGKAPTQVYKGAARATQNVPESPVGSVATKFISNTIESRVKKTGKPLTPENIVIEANKMWKEIYGEDYTPGKVPGNKNATSQNAQVETPTDPTQPYNNGVDSQGNSIVRPQATRTKQVDTMIAQSIANTVRGMKNFGQSEKFKNSAVEGLSTLLDNRDAIPYIFDENGNPNVDVTKHTPVSQAIADTKNDLWTTQIEPLIAEATQAGATIESIPIVQSISDTLQGFKLSNGSIIPGTEGAYNTMLKMANMFMDSDGNIKPISISDAQRISQALNKMAKPLYQGSSAGDVLTMMAIDGMNRILRPMIDQGVEIALDRAGLSELKRRRGALTNIEAPITKRGQVVDRQPQAGLFGGLSDLYGGSELAGSFVQLASGDIGGFVSGVVRAGATKLISRYLKNMNDRNRILAKLMIEIDKQRKGFKIPGGYKNVPKATQGYRPMKGTGLPAGTPTPVGPNGPIVKVPNPPASQPKVITESYAPGYKNQQEEAVITEKKTLLKKKADEEKIKSEQEAERIKKDGFENYSYMSSVIDGSVGGVSPASDYGDYIVSANVDPRSVQFDVTGEFVVSGTEGVKNIEFSKYKKANIIQTKVKGEIDMTKEIEPQQKKQLITKKEFEPTMERLEENGEEMNAIEAKGEFNAGRKVRLILDDGFTEYPLGDVITEISDIIGGGEYMVYDVPQDIFPGNKEKKEYNTPEKKPLLTKKPINDGSKLQTKQGGTVGPSNEVKQVSLIEKKIPVESENKGTGTSIQLKGGYSSDNVINGDGYGTGLSKKQQGELNKEVIRILESKNFSKNIADYTSDEIQKLMKYEGGGGVTKAEGDFSGSNDEFYTPAKIIDDMRYLAKKYGFKEGAKVLEPSAGTGRFIRRKPNWTGKTTGMEIDKVSGTIAAITNPEQLIKIGDFQDQFMDFTGNKPLSESEIEKLPKYDIVIGNPPYKLRTTKQRNLGDLKNVDRFEDYFMIRGMQLLKDGGIMTVIVPSSFLDKPNYLAKNILRDSGAILIDAYRLPNKTFPNTDVGTDIIVFKKGAATTAENMDFFKNTADGERFKQNPTKVLGEIGERTNRFGKMEKYVKGTMEDVKISEPKNSIADLGPLTITNMVTGKQEIIPTPDIVIPKKSDTLGIERQKSTKDSVSKITNTILDIIESNGGLVNRYIKVSPEGYMPLYIEGIGNNEIAVAHTYIQNGDVMRDPEVVFKVRNGELVAQTIQQDPYGIKEIRPTDDFLGERADNLREQGFVKQEQNIGAKDMLEKEKLPQTEKAPLLTKKTPVAEPTTTTTISQPKSIINKPSQPISGGLFDIPTEKQAIQVAKNILNPVIEQAPKGLSNRILGASNISPEDIQGLLKYQANTNVLGEVEGIEYTENPALLNYMDGKTYVNYNYFSGDIYYKLDQLELDKNRITPEQYEKQKKGLLEVLPEPQVLDNMTFNVTNEGIMNTNTKEIHTVRESKYDPIEKRTTRYDVEKPMTIKDQFKEWLRGDGLPSRSRVSANEIISYFEGRKLSDKERKGMIVEDSNYYFDKFIKEALDPEIQDNLVRMENIRNRSIADIDTTKVPFIIKDLSKTFRGSNLNFKEVQINSAIKMALKGSYISSLGAGYGKTMVGILGMVRNMQNGFAKRPLIIVPKQTMKGREETIRAMFPTYKLNVLGSLDSKGRKIAYKERGNDVSKWIEDNTITLVTEEAYVGQMAFTDKTTNRVKSELQDDMEAKNMSDKQRDALADKNEADLGATAVGKAKSNEKGVDMSMFNNERVKEQYQNLQNMTHEQFIDSFVRSAEQYNRETMGNMSKEQIISKAKELLSIEPMYIEKMGFDMFLVDELHNFKNIFAKAKISDTESGGKGKNMYGDVVGSTSKKGMKMMIGANYVQSINNGRGFLGLTATPFNNQAIEVYNIMNLVGRTRLKKMGITNMNDFMSNFSTFKEELVVQLGKVGYKSIQKGFVNLQSMQRLVNEHIDFKGDDPDIIKPELKKIYATLQMSDVQKELQLQIEEDMMDKSKPGAMIGGAQNARVNNVSPYFTSYLRDSSFTPEELLKNSPKLDFFADIVIENRKNGNKDLSIMFLPYGKELHGMLAEGLSKKTGIPISRIGIINSIPKYKSKMFETINKANNGELDILIGGKTINEGVDLQHKTYILYDTILGWNPTEPVQKIARGRRQGNLRSYVVAIRPQLENSIDSFMFQKVEEKQARINDIFSGEGEVFDVEDVDPAEEKLALITDPIKKAQIYIEIEQRKLQRSIELLKGEIGDIEKWKADIDEEINTLPNILGNIEKYKSFNGDYSEYINTMKKQAESIKGKAKRARENIEKRGINISADLVIKQKELELLNQEVKDIQEQYPAKVKQYEIDNLDAISKRKPRKYYIDQINNITNELKMFENVGQQAEFKKSLLSKK